MRRLSVLVIHNRYCSPGGEDAVVRAETELLRRAGHRVVQFTRINGSIARFSPWRKAALFAGTTWNREVYRDLRRLIREEKPDVAHCHNLVPLISPSAYYACQDAGVPVIQTLHNYRLLCPKGTLYDDSRSCHDCLGSLMHGVWRGCYRGSRLQTAALAGMLAIHRRLGTWQHCVGAYIALSRFSRSQLLAAGFPLAKVHVKPNFLSHEPKPRPGRGEYAVFVGRLSPEKGIMEMLKVWQHLTHIPLKVIGDGPLLAEAVEFVEHSRCNHIQFLGARSPEQVLQHLRGALFLVFPSRWPEPFGLVLLEAAGCGVPALAARTGGVPEIVTDGETGLLFDPEDAGELATKACWAWAHPAEMESLGAGARQSYLRNFTAERNYQQLMNVYSSLLPN